MPAQVVLVHPDEAFLRCAHEALRAEGLHVASFSNAMRALDALQGAETVDLLITSLMTGAGGPNGRSLALMTRSRRPEVHVIFLGSPDQAHLVTDLGLFLTEPTALPQLVSGVRQALHLPAFTTEQTPPASTGCC